MIRTSKNDGNSKKGKVVGHKEFRKRLSPSKYRLLSPEAQYDKNTRLLEASARGMLEIAEDALEEKADINTKNEYGWTPLILAAWNGKEEVVRFLLKHNPSVNTQDKINSYSALMWATLKGHAEIVKLLIEHGAEVNARDEHFGHTALMLASMKGHVKTINHLLEAGANPDLVDTGGLTALMHAARYGRDDAARILLRLGADANITGPKGYTAFTLAVFVGHMRVAEVIDRHFSIE